MSMDRCFFCKGKIVKKKVEHVHRWRHSFYLFTDVPAEVCTQCGEVYLSPEAMDRMDRVATHPTAVKKEIRIPVFSLS